MKSLLLEAGKNYYSERKIERDTGKEGRRRNKKGGEEGEGNRGEGKKKEKKRDRGKGIENRALGREH